MPDARFDAAVLRLRFDDEPCDDVPRLLRLGLLFGRYRLVKRLRHLLDDDAYLRFVHERALPQVPIGGDVQRGFAVDEAVLAEIAADLGQPLAPLLAATVRLMLARGSRHLAKLYVLARLARDEALVAQLQPAFDARARHPRRALAAEVVRRFDVALLQAGDDDDFNPKSAALFAGRDLVIKERLSLHVDPARLDGYSEERALLEELRHPRIVKLVDVATLHQDRRAALSGHELLLLERARGETLDGARHPQARRIVRQLAEVLAWLHARGVLYLDVKPQNVLFDGRDVTLCDFGMARRGAQVTSVPSTLEYVPPELARDFVASDKSDVFQLGIVLHQLLTGRHPFADGEGIEVALANLWQPPRATDELVLAMLAKDPAQRPSAADVAARLA